MAKTTSEFSIRDGKTQLTAKKTFINVEVGYIYHKYRRCQQEILY